MRNGQSRFNFLDTPFLSLLVPTGLFLLPTFHMHAPAMNRSHRSVYGALLYMEASGRILCIVNPVLDPRKHPILSPSQLSHDLSTSLSLGAVSSVLPPYTGNMRHEPRTKYSHLVPCHEEWCSETCNGECGDLDSEPWLVLDRCG